MDSELIGEDFLDFKCPYCGALNSFPTSAAGLARECLNCMELFLAPLNDGGAARMLPLPVEAPRIRLRKFQPTDWQDLMEFQFEDEDEATGWIHSVNTVQPAEMRPPLFLAVEVKEASKVVGTLGFRFIDRSFNQVEVTLASNRDAGLPDLELEAFETALDFCFQDLKLHRVIAQCETTDAQSRQLFNALGMRQEAEFVKHRYVRGEWFGTNWFAILSEEYFTDAPGGERKTS